MWYFGNVSLSSCNDRRSRLDLLSPLVQYGKYFHLYLKAPFAENTTQSASKFLHKATFLDLQPFPPGLLVRKTKNRKATKFKILNR